METIVGAAFALLFLFVMQMLVINTTERTDSLRHWRPILMLIALIWWAAPLAKKAYVDDFFYPDDSVVHEGHARDIAYLINQGDWEQLRGYAGLGNEGYRCAMGAFYAITGAPELTIYQIHAMLAFWGLLCLLEMGCAHTRAERVPLWLLLFCLFNPSALFWTTFNLKEGAMLWGLCLTLRAAVNLNGTDQHGRQRSDSLFWPAVGMLVAGFLRPHIVVAYMAALAIGVAVRKGQVGWAVVATVGMVAGVAGLKVVAPGLYDSLIADGVSVTLNEKFNELNMQGGSAIVYSRGAPIPLVSGFVLLTLRPFPWEAFDAQALAAGAEVWIMAAIAIIGWLSLKERLRLLGSSYMITLLVAFFALAFYFTYIYNMGLMVRQRVMVFPAMLSFAMLPFLARTAKAQMNAPMVRSRRRVDQPVYRTRSVFLPNVIHPPHEAGRPHVAAQAARPSRPPRSRPAVPSPQLYSPIDTSSQPRRA